ncbi:MAG: nucleotide sugar dehydrogenase [Runella slithyformis]|nr:MAG: nucleotide sugar dehydrogenase [Runella slithyformis]TAF96589.1 MAG: nucleotide sugar dehydrogenase [Runella sp.]TAG19936.1 MAG: nucleotide sugar dehydrogenase [Cytophagales bacterium]TAG40079.1 MAG: nucleotide sugar dehydrogenase [Cytophagia bacterium]TAE98349.1 MAG: nucleotide sugar dehydrogenase [Runella slithyformis]
MYQELLRKEKQIAVVGLGYVGLPIALEFAKHFRVIGFDINRERVALMQQGQDPSRELEETAFVDKDITFTANPADLKNAHFFVVAVPTPVDDYKVPDLKPLIGASETIGKMLKKGDYVIYESTVYPGCTEEDCLPLLEKYSGLKLANDDFKIGYSPERINPGDKERTIDKILKIVSGNDDEALEEIAQVYGQIITAGIYKATSVKVAEAAKVIENTQRDLNISLMNELAIIFDKMGISTKDVIEAAATKWNFIKLSPGLVGGHCIGIDPYYLLYKAKKLGYDPQVIHSGRRINDGMPAFIAKRLVQMITQKGKSLQNAKVLVMGITFKENVSDIRNSKVADLIKELMQFSVNVHIVDPYASPNEVAHEYNLTLLDKPSDQYDAVLVTVAHDQYKNLNMSHFRSLMGDQPILMDLKSLYNNDDPAMTYWQL